MGSSRCEMRHTAGVRNIASFVGTAPIFVAMVLGVVVDRPGEGGTGACDQRTRR